jgi:two-component system sensor kinase FixL
VKRELPARPNARSAVLPVLAAAIAAGIFILDTVAPPEVAMAVLYVAVVLIAARFLQRRGVLLVALGCVGLAVLSHVVSLQGPSSTVALVDLIIGVAAIGISAYLAVLNQASEMASRERAHLLDVAHDAIFVRDLDEAITYWNRGAEERYGWSSEQALGKVSHHLLHTVFPAPLETIKEELMRTGRWEGELVHTRRDGSTIVVASRWSLQKDTRGKPAATLETDNDITERKRSQEALDRAQADLAHVNRVTTLGELTASIAHEVNQPIAGAVTNADAALRFLAASPPDLEEVREALDAIVKDGKRAGEILGRIRALVRKAPAQKEQFDINQAILEVVALTRTEVHRSAVTLQTQLQPGLPPLMGDRIQLQQVVLNFILNAVEATSGVDRYSRHVVVSSTKDSNGVIVAVRDTGVGLDPDSIDRVFQPFYTTKTSGMGMGLSICRSIIEAHGGRVRAARNDDAGATFQFTLPTQQASEL